MFGKALKSILAICKERQFYINTLVNGSKKYNPDLACSIFERDTGIKMLVGNDYDLQSFSLSPSKMLKYIRKGKFPTDIKYALIGHGEGSSIDNSWHFIGDNSSVKDFLLRNVPKNEKAIVFTCESTPKELMRDGLPNGIGSYVNTELTSLRHPAKIVRNGEIIGEYARGKVLYY